MSRASATAPSVLTPLPTNQQIEKSGGRGDAEYGCKEGNQTVKGRLADGNRSCESSRVRDSGFGRAI